MIWKKLDRPPIEGELNTLFFVTNESDSLFLKRVPKENNTLLEQIETEYTKTMFLPLGGQFRIRSPKEQFLFSTKAARAGLKVLSPVAIENEAIYYPFLKNTSTIKRYFSSKKVKVSHILNQLFNDLRRAHALGIVYGDRWLPNILVKPNHEVVHIDFDIEIFGKWAKEFEVSQVIYYTTLAGKKLVLPTIIEYFKAEKWFNSSVVSTFLDASVKFFKNSKYGGINNLVADIISGID